MPSTIASTARTANAGAWSARAGFATAGGLYVVTQDTGTGKFSVWKSTNGTTWTEQDAGDAPTNFSATHPYGCTLAGTFVYLIYFTASGTIRVRRFDTATDQWETGDVGGDIATGVQNAVNVAVAVRSDGDVVVAYNSAAASVSYARYEGTSWTAGVANTTAHWVNDLVMDGDDRAWGSFADNTNNDNTYRSYSSANAMGTSTDFDNTAHTTAKLRTSLAVLFNDGTDNRYAQLGRDTGGELDLYHGTTGGTTLGSLATVNAVTTTTSPNTTAAGLAVHNGQVRAVWSTANAILYDSSTSLATLTFGGDTTLLSGLADADPCPQWIVGGGGLGVVYQESGDVKVEWVASPSFGVAGTMTVAPAEATAAGEAVTFDAAASFAVAAAAATAAGGTVAFTAASKLAIGAAAADALGSYPLLNEDGTPVLDGDGQPVFVGGPPVLLAGQGRLAVDAATATAAGGAVAFPSPASLAVVAASATADAGAVVLLGCDADAELGVAVLGCSVLGEGTVPGSLAVDAATATAAGGTVALTAASVLAVAPAIATGNGGTVALTAASAFAVAPATSTADGGAVDLVACDPGATLGTAVLGCAVAGYGTASMGVAPATATAAGGTVALTAASALTATAATATADGGTVALAGQGVLAATPATATADGGTVGLAGAAAFAATEATATAAADATLDAAAVFAVTPAAATADAFGTLTGESDIPGVLGINAAQADAAGGDVRFTAPGTLGVAAATATADAAGALVVPNALTVDAATATAQAASSLTGSGRLAATEANATASGGTVSLDAAARLTLTAAIADATADGALTGQGSLAVQPAASSASADGAFVAAASLAIDPAPATADAAGSFTEPVAGITFRPSGTLVRLFVAGGQRPQTITAGQERGEFVAGRNQRGG